MPIPLTPAEAKALEKRIAAGAVVVAEQAAPKDPASPRKPRTARKPRRAMSAEPQEAVVGVLSGTRHLWRFKQTINGVAAELWQSECYTFSQHGEPQDGEAAVNCERCFPREQED